MIVSKHNCLKSESRTRIQKGEVASPFIYGEVAERFKAAVLKTVDRDERSEGSNPSFPANVFGYLETNGWEKSKVRSLEFKIYLAW